MELRGGRYEILQLIASGGMATVHLGRALGMGGFERLVAIKTMHAHLADEPEFVAMFLDEARLAAQIRHPNVVGTIDVQQDDRGVFIVMEYIEGASLQQLLRALYKQGATLPLDIALRVFLDMLAGLHAAHELTDPRGLPLHLVHRDVSPQNVLIGVDGVARITDFGVARAEARISTTHGSQLKGKIGYMSPEQAGRLPVDRRTDVYAAAVLLWELMALERLVRGDSEAEMLAKVVASETPSPRSVNPDVPEALDAVCMRGLEKNPDVRYATAADFAEALDDAVRSMGMKLATPRAVASFIRAQGIHTPLVELRSKSSEEGQAALVPTRIENPSSGRARVSSPSDVKAAESASAVIVPPEESRGRRMRPATLAMAVVATVALAAGAFWGLRPPRTNEVAPAASSTPAPSIDSPAAATTPSAAAAPPPPASPPEAPAPLATESARVAPASSKAGKNTATTKRDPSTPATATARASGGPMYRPPEL
ncbi:serine/threonine-protein kinase [Polyangium jinanense]|uniref:Serine/threonine protein kinase n=1 Tax=Polyangium jinanense TaxID=2829994 RepID=A0A9X3XB47_9BACT|nr:serine/threonine-protein kinase [Polyangium jinanense]MDC3957037.1 serine/threonine protein kinase [Polyangium jinanense]MDC3987089.1 serine/threonine protein kinase [Polyangium jinanense]